MRVGNGRLHCTGADTCTIVAAVALQLGYDALGKPENDEAFEEYRLDPGNVSERRWELLNWQRPADETAPCWWVANASDTKS